MSFTKLKKWVNLDKNYAVTQSGQPQKIKKEYLNYENTNSLQTALQSKLVMRVL